jgi:hypothetical protein
MLDDIDLFEAEVALELLDSPVSGLKPVTSAAAMRRQAAGSSSVRARRADSCFEPVGCSRFKMATASAARSRFQRAITLVYALSSTVS